MERSRLHSVLVRFGLAPQPDGSKYPSWVSSRLYAAAAVLLTLGQVLHATDGIDGAWGWFTFVVLWLLIVTLIVSALDLHRQGR